MNRMQAHLKHPRQRKHQPAPHANQEYRRHIQQERHAGVAQHNQGTDSRHFVEGLEPLGEGDDEEVDEGADGGVVVQGDERVHLESVQQDLDHDEAGGFELRAGMRGGWVKRGYVRVSQRWIFMGIVGGGDRRDVRRRQLPA